MVRAVKAVGDRRFNFERVLMESCFDEVLSSKVAANDWTVKAEQTNVKP
jgi:hypothetical protein